LASLHYRDIDITHAIANCDRSEIEHATQVDKSIMKLFRLPTAKLTRS